MKRVPLLIVLVLIFGVLLALTVYQSRPIPPAQVMVTPLFERVFPEMTVLSIQAIRLEDPNTGETLTLNRASDGTWIAPGLDGELDTDAATQIARTIVLLPYRRTLRLDDSTDLAQYGFRPNGQLFVQVALINGETHIVAVGDFVEAALTYYALVDERNEVILLEGGPVRFLLDSLESPPVA